MTDQPRSSAQRHATPAMEAESRAWMVQCPHCGFERSVWDTGGIRYKAAGTSRNYMRCPNCGKRGWNRIHWGGGPSVVPGVPDPAQASAGFVIKLVLGIVVGTLLATSAIIYGAFKLFGVH